MACKLIMQGGKHYRGNVQGFVHHIHLVVPTWPLT
ncbi:hypothetical protein CFBP1573P_02577 [Pseudomonas syringae pv. persicae]|uniref:Transposase n=1 Tax=Pseudomonas syringae pv. persicae TaxID=237306 RepID=A0AB38EDP4_9PSED|nr:hypothetical protein CFBP1573P_02577 [Pseudomonas syringae pv. persicae]SOQ09560.1 hypothetical protein NCPPB2254_02374 [Pseudomonas syringae pv. persicae]